MTTLYQSVPDVAQALGVCDETIRRMARDGRLPCIKVGKKLKFKMAEVVKHLEGK